MEPTSCLFCFEALSEPIQNPIGCPCKIIAHPTCLQSWFHQKNQMECPICHTIAIPNPMPVMNIVYVDRIQQEEELFYRRHNKAIGICCCIFLGWSLGLIILEFIFKRW